MLSSGRWGGILLLYVMSILLELLDMNFNLGFCILQYLFLDGKSMIGWDRRGGDGLLDRVKN